MTLENFGPLMDELCAVLHGKGYTVRGVSVTYAPLATENVPDLPPPSAGWTMPAPLSTPRGVPGVTTAHGR